MFIWDTNVSLIIIGKMYAITFQRNFIRKIDSHNITKHIYIYVSYRNGEYFLFKSYFFSQRKIALWWFFLMIKAYGRHRQYPIYILLGISIWEHYSPPTQLLIASLSSFKNFLLSKEAHCLPSLPQQFSTSDWERY